MPDPWTTTAILAAVFSKLVDKLTGNVLDGALSKLRTDPAKHAFQQALGSAIEKYANSGTRLRFARVLLDERGPLQATDVAEELGHLLRFERRPDAVLIGGRWRDALDEVPSGYDFTSETNTLLHYLELELRATEAFQQVFEQQSLLSLDVSTRVSNEVLRQISDQLESIRRLVDSHYGKWLESLSGSPVGLRHQVRDFARLMDDKTQCFVGREFIFSAVAQFIDNNRCGYFAIKGDPGIGKSAFAAEYIKRHGCVHHFNVRAEGINRPDAFLKNVCAQLILTYNLPHTDIPAEATQDSGFLATLLEEASSSTASRILIVVDGLDEVDMSCQPKGANPLYLPRSLPPDVFFIVTSRKDTLDSQPVLTDLSVSCPHEVLHIEQNQSSNTNDIRTHIHNSMNKDGICKYIVKQGIDRELFVDLLADKSQGNFMYLYHVLPAIDRGLYQDLALDAIPTGLRNYYEDHWRRIRDSPDDNWFDVKLPVITALTAVYEPIPVEMIQAFSGISRFELIISALQEWAQFLFVENVHHDQQIERRYRVYHSTFTDFIRDKSCQREPGVNLEKAHSAIATALLQRFSRT